LPTLLFEKARSVLPLDKAESDTMSF